MEEESQSSSVEDEDHVVFLCSQCNVPVGDSGDQETNLDNEEIILLRAVTSNVEIDANKEVSLSKPNCFSILQSLFCKGCSSSIGVLYVATPRSLEYRRELFSLKKCAVTCYSFTNADKQRERKSQENRRNVSSLEAQLKKCRTMFGQCLKAVSLLEANKDTSSGTD